ncbi:MAG: acyltransferase [Gemmatimonadaceae bacterium]
MPTAELSKCLVNDRSERIPALDALRGIAMLAVVACHLVFPSATSQFDAIDRVMINGWIGVDLFFVLSGFLITGILIDTRDDGRYFRNFYLRRALRIFPIYYLLLVVLFVWIPFGSWVFAHGMSGEYGQLHAHQSWYWTYTVNILQERSSNLDWFWTGHLWSLSIEEQFYLVWPAIVLVIPRRHLALACAIAFVAAVGFRAWWVATHVHRLGAYVLTPMRMDSLAAGAFVAAMARTASGTRALRKLYRPIGLIALAVALPLLAVYGSDLQSLPMSVPGYSLNAVVFAAAIVWLLDDPRPRRWLDSKFLRRIGRVSYGSYLYHLPLIGVCVALRTRLMNFGDAGGLARIAAHTVWVSSVVALTLVVAAISYRLIEKPFLDMKNRVTS